MRQFCAATDVDLQRSYFYADGDEDAALMRVVGHPRPVNPRPGLAAEAQRSGWPVLTCAVSRLARGAAPADWAAMMARTVRRHRPHSEPAPHAAATSFEVRAPAATASATAWFVMPMHRHTYIRAGPWDPVRRFAR